MVQTRVGPRLTCEAAAHIAVVGVIPQDHLDGDPSIKGRTLPPLVDGSHATNTDTLDHIIVAKLLAFQSQHRVRLSFRDRG